MNEPTPAGTLGLVRPAWHHLNPGRDASAGELYQTSLMSALVEGVYEGQTTYGDLRAHGDFGLGTFNDLDGEMVGFDGTFYQLRSDGTASPVTPDQRTPFAVVTFFRPDRELQLPAGIDKQGVTALIEAATHANLFAAVRIDGTFDRVQTRTVQRQAKPFPPLVDATKGQVTTTFTDVQGTLAGFHLHFLRHDRLAGGHALDYRVRAGTVRLGALRGFHVELPTTGDFLKADFGDPTLNAQIRSSEG